MKKPSVNENPFKCQLLACNCENTFSIDAKRLAQDLDLEEVPDISHNLCRSQIPTFEQAISENRGLNTIITCTQEAPLFEELASEHIGDERPAPDLTFVNIRETAGWSVSGNKASAKMAALIASAAYQAEPTGLVPIHSHGRCVVYGAGQVALETANKLASHLNVSLILTGWQDIVPQPTTNFPVHKGNIIQASGSIGKFNISLENYAPVVPSSKSALEFIDSETDTTIETDLIFDLSDGEPLVGRQHGRDGYVHVDPKNPVAIARAMFDIIDLVGEFEKPIFVSYDPSICAHSRSGQIGCSNCIDNCPTSAITSRGDNVLVNNEICDGCGHCSSSCPTGAIAYALPNRADLIGQGQILLSTFLKAGGKHPVVMLHESQHGGDLIAAMARFGDGLGENVLPLSVYSITHVGHDVLSALFTAGAQRVVLLVPDKKQAELDALAFQVKLANRLLEGMEFDIAARVSLVVEDDPDRVAEALANIPAITMPAAKNFTASKNKRETARLAVSNLNAMAPKKQALLELPAGAPYGAISIDPEKCTLCLACVGACPVNALGDHEDRPQVSFTEHTCVQCGLCKATCPENAITLTARYNFDKSALSPVVLNAEEPLECSRCGKPFGSKAAIDKVIGILAGKNPMFQTSQQLDMLKMCENCRVIAMAETEKDPMTLGTVPKTLTAGDVLPEDDEPTKH